MTNAFSFDAATATVMVFKVESIDPSSAVPRSVYVIDPSEFLTAVPQMKLVDGAGVPVVVVALK